MELEVHDTKFGFNFASGSSASGGAIRAGANAKTHESIPILPRMADLLLGIVPTWEIHETAFQSNAARHARWVVRYTPVMQMSSFTPALPRERYAPVMAPGYSSMSCYRGSCTTTARRASIAATGLMNAGVLPTVGLPMSGT